MNLLGALPDVQKKVLLKIEFFQIFRKMPYTTQDQINELQKKFTLHEGDLKAYEEASKSKIAQNNETIAQLRQMNKLMHRQLAEAVNGDSKVIENALGDRRVERQVNSYLD